MRRTLYDAGHGAFRDTVRTFLAEEVVPHAAEWDRAGIVPRGLFAAAGAQGLTGMAVPEDFGGGGAPDFRFNAVLGEEVMRVGIGAGSLVPAIAMTEPGHSRMSLLGLERGMPGFERGRNLDKLGQHAQDTAELSFSGVRVSAAELPGEEGRAFPHLVDRLPQERLGIAVAAVAGVAAALEWTLEHVGTRTAFGQPIGSFQNTRFGLAEIATEVDVARAYVDACVRALGDGELTAVDAAKATWWCTELQGRALDTCLQLYGGYGCMAGYPIPRAWADARVTRIYGGTTETMEEVVGRDLGL